MVRSSQLGSSTLPTGPSTLPNAGAVISSRLSADASFKTASPEDSGHGNGEAQQQQLTRTTEEVREREKAERKEKRAKANIITAALTTVFALLFEFVLDALSGGSCMILLPAVFSGGWWAYEQLVKLIFGSTTYYDGPSDHAPPAPPIAPSLATTLSGSLFDYAEAEPYACEHRGTETRDAHGWRTA